MCVYMLVCMSMRVRVYMHACLCIRPICPLATILGAPDAPRDVYVEFTIPTGPTSGPQDVHITWTAPQLPGGKPVSVDSYLVEMKPQEGRSWYPAPFKQKITTTNATLSTLEMKDDVMYQFRVCALNEFGKSPPSKPSSPVLVGKNHVV